MEVKAIVIPTSLEDKPYLTTIRDYKDYYSAIGCDTFDCFSLYIEANLSVDCYIDDNGLGIAPVNMYFMKPYRAGVTSCPIFGRVVINVTDIDTGENAELDLCLVRKALSEIELEDDVLSSISQGGLNERA